MCNLDRGSAMSVVLEMELGMGGGGVLFAILSLRSFKSGRPDPVNESPIESP
jgi:hypothetical protein